MISPRSHGKSAQRQDSKFKSFDTHWSVISSTEPWEIFCNSCPCIFLWFYAGQSKPLSAQGLISSLVWGFFFPQRKFYSKTRLMEILKPKADAKKRNYTVPF